MPVQKKKEFQNLFLKKTIQEIDTHNRHVYEEKQ